MVADRQTHSLPEQPRRSRRSRVFMGYADAAAFAAALLRHLERVQHRYREVFELVPEPPGGPVMALDFTGVGEPSQHTLAALKDMGYNNPATVYSGDPRLEVRPAAGAALGACARADVAGAAGAAGRVRAPAAAGCRRSPGSTRSWRACRPACSCCRCSSAIPALLDRVAAVLGRRTVAGRPPGAHAVRARGPADARGGPGLARPHPRAALPTPRSLEDAIAVIRRTVREEDFAISVATLEARIDADAAGLLRSALADAALAALLPRVLEDFSGRFGQVRGGGLAWCCSARPAGGR